MLVTKDPNRQFSQPSHPRSRLSVSDPSEGENQIEGRRGRRTGCEDPRSRILRVRSGAPVFQSYFTSCIRNRICICIPSTRESWWASIGEPSWLPWWMESRLVRQEEICLCGAIYPALIHYCTCTCYGIHPPSHAKLRQTIPYLCFGWSGHISTFRA